MGGKISIVLASLLVSVNLFGANSSYPYGFTEYNGNSYFFATDENGTKLFKSDGTKDGTIAISGVIGDEPDELTVFNSKLYFSAYDETNGQEIWESDGTSSGTKLLKDLKAGDTSSSPHNFVIFDNKLYFIAKGSASDSIWESDGTANGTTILSTAENVKARDLTVVNSNLLLYINQNLGVLYKHNESGTPLFYIPYAQAYGFTAYKDKLYFQATNPTNSSELWVSDGTASETKLFKDIIEGDSPSYPWNFKVCGDLLYFTADDGTNGIELRVTDGTEDNVTLVKDINSGGNILNDIDDFDSGCFGNKLYFTANNGTDGVELWVTDGTEANTKMLKYINTDADSYPSNFAVFDNKLYFRANDGTNGKELWVTDGTEANTQMVKDIEEDNEDGSRPYGLTVIGNKLYFQAENSENGRELWITDGTESGTQMVRDINYDNKIPTISNLSIDGTISVASKLTANYTYSDIDNDDENGTMFLWYKADEANGTNATLIKNSGFFVDSDDYYPTSSTYIISADDIGKYIKVIVAPMDSNYLKNSFMDEYGENYTITDIQECLDENRSYCRSYDSGYTTTAVPSKVNLTSVITANKWSMITVPDDINISASDISGATIFSYDSNNSEWETPITLESYKGYWLYTSSTSGYEYISAIKSEKNTTIESISSSMPSNSFSLIGNSLTPLAYTASIPSVDLDQNHLPIGYFSFFLTMLSSSSNRFCNIDEYYYDRENDSWNTTNGLPYLGGFWVNLSNCIKAKNQDN